MLRNGLAADVLARTQVGIILCFRRVSGAKSFSSCSFEDFENFLKHNPECPYIRVARRGPLPRAAVCGNGVMEHGEQCDCGSVAVSAGQRGGQGVPCPQEQPQAWAGGGPGVRNAALWPCTEVQLSPSLGAPEVCCLLGGWRPGQVRRWEAGKGSWCACRHVRRTNAALPSASSNRA